MNPFAEGIDISISGTPAGTTYAFPKDATGTWGNDFAARDGSFGFGTSGTSGEYGIKDFGLDFLGGLGKGLLGSSSNVSSSGYPRSSTPYTDRTKDLLSVLLSQAVSAFKPVQSTIS